MKKPRIIYPKNYRKKPRQPLAECFLILFILIAGVAGAFYKPLHKPKPYKEPKPVVLYKPAEKKKLATYKPKSKRERQQIIASIWNISDANATLREWKTIKRK